MQLNCPWCGVRDEPEFICGGPAQMARPALDCDDQSWGDYAAELAAAGEASESQNQRRFRTELNELKRLVEQTALAAPSKRSPPTSRHPGP